jgi:hypothetical protein
MQLDVNRVLDLRAVGIEQVEPVDGLRHARER